MFHGGRIPCLSCLSGPSEALQRAQEGMRKFVLFHKGIGIMKIHEKFECHSWLNQRSKGSKVCVFIVFGWFPLYLPIVPRFSHGNFHLWPGPGRSVGTKAIDLEWYGTGMIVQWFLVYHTVGFNLPAMCESRWSSDLPAGVPHRWQERLKYSSRCHQWKPKV